MPKIVTKILFLKNNSKTKQDFCNIYIINKKYKIHNKKLFINIINKFAIPLYANLVCRKNKLPKIGNYRYRTIFINKTIYIKSLIITKLKNTIYNKNKIFLNKIKIYINKKIYYFSQIMLEYMNC